MSIDFTAFGGALIEIVSWILILGGVFFLFVGSLGMIRLQDFWSRLHAASIIDSVGRSTARAGLSRRGW